MSVIPVRKYNIQHSFEKMLGIKRESRYDRFKTYIKRKLNKLF